MTKSNQQPLTAPRGQSPHDFKQPFASWEASIFDNAKLFAVIDYTTRLPFKRNEFSTVREAVEFARTQTRSCVYAVSSEGRFVLLDRERWDDWIERERENSR